MAKGRGAKVNRAGLAATFGVALPTVDNWLRAGCPFDQRGAGRGKEWQFDCGDVADWLQAKAREDALGDSNDIDALKARKLAAEAGLAELELAQAKGEVALVREFERAQAGLMAVIRQNVMNVPQRVVLTLLGETDETIFKTKLRAELAAALQQASEAEIPLDDDDDA